MCSSHRRETPEEKTETVAVVGEHQPNPLRAESKLCPWPLRCLCGLKWPSLTTWVQCLGKERTNSRKLPCDSVYVPLYTNRQTDRPIHKHVDTKIGGQTDTDIYTDTQTHTETHR